jgi:hypothetical protein
VFADRSPHVVPFDCFAYGVIPAVSYVVIAAAGIMFAVSPDRALHIMAAGLLLLLLINIRNAWDLVLTVVRLQGAREKTQAKAKTLVKQSDLYLSPGAHFAEHFDVADRLGENVAGTGEPGFVALADRRAAKPDRDGAALRPVSDLTRRHDRPRLWFARHADRNVEINFFAPGQQGR